VVRSGRQASVPDAPGHRPGSQYPDLLDAFRTARRLDSLHDGTDPLVSHILDIEALCTAFEANDHALLVRLLSAGSVNITRHRDKGRIARALNNLTATRHTMTVSAVFDHVQESGLLAKSAEIRARERSLTAKNLEECAQRRADLTRSVLALPYSQGMAFSLYENGETPLATQHGVKGAEFDDVVVVIDDKARTLYSVNEMLADPAGKKDRIHRTKNLFYVSCSRARNRLAVVFLSDVSPAAETTARAWFSGGTIHT
jgi:DNA helicase-2/ATP-dependent DNA helicase PcrA